MKNQALIVSAVSLAVVAVPVVGMLHNSASAATTQSDTLSLTVNEQCTFVRSSGSNSKSTTMAMNALDTSMTNTFKVTCNIASGYSVSAAFTALDGPGADITYSATTPTAGSGTWTATKGAASATSNIPASGGTLMSASGVTSSSGTTQQVTYKVGTASNQASGSYEGTATYTLTATS